MVASGDNSRKRLAALAGPIVWLLDGPCPILYISFIDSIFQIFLQNKLAYFMINVTFISFLKAVNAEFRQPFLKFLVICDNFKVAKN
jgi:hypothetical protein